MIPHVLTIAGSDPSGGAGIQADLKTIAANGGYGMAVLTALTAQNTQGVQDVHLLPPGFVTAQITAVADDIRVDAAKIGMIASAGIAQAVADGLDLMPGVPVVLDPVMIAKGGAALLDAEAVAVLREVLLPRATLLTPNLPEAAALLGQPVASDRAGMEAQALALCGMGPEAVLLKGGHLDGAQSPDLLADADGLLWLDGPRHATRNTHGTGCTLSAAAAAMLGKGLPMTEAARRAKDYVAGTIRAADDLRIGKAGGHGPLHHFHALWAKGT